MKSFVLPVGKLNLLRFIEEHGEEKLLFEIRPYKKPRSEGLNNYVWGVVVTPLAEHVGETPNRMWEICCGEYFGWVEKEFRGHRYQKPRRTTTTNENGERSVLNWEEMTNFVEFCKTLCVENGVPISEVA
jgi:hypothetical protein